MRYIIEGDYIEAHIDDGLYYCTNAEGYGLFKVESYKNNRVQLLGTCQFSVKGLSQDSKRKKINKIIKTYMEDVKE